MSSEPIVHKEKPVQSQVNPFAKHLPDHVSAGAVAIESERAIAEAQGKLVIAKRFPRDQARAYSNIIDACKRAGLAEEACYSFPRGGQTVSGPSIRLAEMLAANWGNIDYGIRELSRKEGVSEMEAYCWDLETNTMSSQKFTVRHIRDTRGGGVKLTDERDIYELTANMGGRRLRARILAILPADLIQAAVDECTRTLAGGNDAPIADRIRNMVLAFKTLGVATELIEKRLGHKLDTITPDELGDLRKIHNSIRDGISKTGDWFNDGTAPSAGDEDLPGDPPSRPAPPPRAATGAAAVKAAAKEVVVEPEPVAPAPEQKSEPKPVQQAAPAPAPAPKAAEPVPAQPATPEPRAFLNENETISVTVEVTSVRAAMSSAGVASAVATVKGGFVGEVTHVGGGHVPDGQKEPVPNAEWAVGNILTIGLRGTKLKSGRIQPRVQSVAVVPKAAEVEE